MMRAVRTQHRVAIALAGALIAAGAVALFMLLRQPPPSTLERIRASGLLVVATRIAPTTYFAGADGPDGFTHALVEAFAQELGVRVRFEFPPTLDALLDDVAGARVHMAAAGLGVTDARRRRMRFSQPFADVEEQLVYRRGTSRPKQIDDVGPGELHVVAGSSQEELLQQLRANGHPNLSWTPHADTDTQSLLAAVDRGELRLTLADANSVDLSRRIYRHVAVAFALADSKPIAWAFPRSGDDSLRRAADCFLRSAQRGDLLQRLQARYFGHTGRLNFVDSRDFWRDVRDRLPALRSLFERAAEITGIDWRLLAAIGYQESHWRSDAVSPTGVRGIMMLTQATAQQMDIDDRDDPEQSIIGGARYLRVVEEKIPERIAEPNRLWLTLAGYNIGFGHLEDARVLTERGGANPDLWMEVKQRLPMLARKPHYETVKHGFARGQEPVDYVDNIRNYYDMLVWFTGTADEATRAYLFAESN
ncbi:MAG: membrane-bound lytic murein transglycosylase MltF [Chromatiaceae bacterium]|nr:membrane-bound lytic murein transglycosylase MltF [Chromatiaceae bacterium]MCP5421331.1 membrane-bound lytic murein transglycosylase MltF [Chromatiaceae bacterium]